MSGPLTRLGALRVADPKAWATQVRIAMQQAKGNRRIAAERLGISWRQLCRWLEDPLLVNVRLLKPAQTGRPKVSEG